MWTALQRFQERLGESYWFIPGLMGAGAIVLAYASLKLEAPFSSSSLASAGWIYTRDATGARDLLSTIGGSLITVTGVVFSVTLVVLTNASSQFGSRILRKFSRDSGSKFVLGAFLGTFLYCLLIMRTITGGPNGFVPHLSVLVGIALSMMCFGLLIFFIHHIIASLQSENVVSDLAADLQSTIRRIFPERVDDDDLKQPSLDQFGGQHTPVVARGSGYIESVNFEELLQCATKYRLFIKVSAVAGAFVLPGMNLATVHPQSDADVLDCVENTFSIGNRRSYVQDLGFAFEQLVLVATRSLSPAVNDQLLAISCIDRITEGLASIAGREIPNRVHLDKDRQPRVLTPPLSYLEIARMALGLVGECASQSRAVTVHILHSIERVSQNLDRPEMRAALVSMAYQIGQRSLQKLSSESDRAAITQALARLQPSDIGAA